MDAMPSTELRLDTRGIPDQGNGTDASKAIELAIASMSPDTNHRIVLIHDGNETTGSVDAAIAAAKSQGIPIDVMPLHYDVQNAVMVERFISPTWKRENEPFTLDVILKSTGSKPIPGKLEVYHRTDRDNVLLEPPRDIVLKPGLNVEHVHVPLHCKRRRSPIRRQVHARPRRAQIVRRVNQHQHRQDQPARRCHHLRTRTGPGSLRR